MQTHLKHPPYLDNLELWHQGKVRDTYVIPDHPDKLLVVATDRISTHDVVHHNAVPGKGEILTAMTVFWQHCVFRNIPTHIVVFGRDIYEYLPKDRVYPDNLHLRSIVVRKLEMIPFELIFRVRMAGSLWRAYREGKPNPYGLVLPDGMQLMDQFAEPVFTPTEKSETDDPVASTLLTEDARYQGAVALALRAYNQGRLYAYGQGIEIIDAKFEVGLDADGNPVLADEWLTGDCGRFVRSSDIRIGKEPPWMDKEIFRQEAALQWGPDGKKYPLVFPEEVVVAGTAAYREVFALPSRSTLEEFHQAYF